MPRDVGEGRATAPEVQAASELERAAEDWIAPYWNADHLLRTRDWLVELEPTAEDALRLAAVTHDIERHFPGGPHADLDDPPDERSYRDAHSRRSADFVSAWLREHQAAEELTRAVEELILLHEWGGTPDADLVQAADSLSFLEVNAALVERWVEEGRCSPERGSEQLAWMLDRVRVPRARDLGEPLFRAAVGRLGITS